MLKTTFTVESNCGQIDLVFQIQDYVYIMEFKLNGNADEALAQIREKGYAAPFAKDRINRK